jgi:flagellar protein FlaG
MSTPVAFPVPVSELNGSATVRLPAEEAQTRESPEAPVAPSADYRLVIEQDHASGAFIYKTLDRRTGEVVQQFPREEVLRLHEDPAYVPGDVIKARS